MEFTGEFFIPGKTEKRIEQDHLARYSFAKKFVSNKSVLDIACGVGYGSGILGPDYAAYHGVDISPENIQYARKTYLNDKTDFREGNVLNYRGEKAYDVIVCFETIEHVSGYKQALNTLNENLVSGGLLIISSPNRKLTSKHARSIYDKPENKYHTQEFLPGELISELMVCGFQKEKIGMFGQRQAYEFRIRLLQKAYNYICKPKFNSSPRVRPVKYKIPRYFILVAEK